MNRRNTTRLIPALPARLLWAALAVLAVLPHLAGGTVELSDLLPLLRRKPQLSGFLFQVYELPASAFAAVRLASYFTHLGGARVGPYVFEARPRDPSAAGTALISLCTEAQFLDGAGDPLPFGVDDEPPIKARAVREELTAIVIREPAAIHRGLGCP